MLPTNAGVMVLVVVAVVIVVCVVANVVVVLVLMVEAVVVVCFACGVFVFGYGLLDRGPGQTPRLACPQATATTNTPWVRHP